VTQLKASKCKTCSEDCDVSGIVIVCPFYKEISDEELVKRDKKKLKSKNIKNKNLEYERDI